MRVFSLVCILVSVLSFSGVNMPLDLSAAVVERDWKVPGDGLLTYDDMNRREWLDLSLTVLSDQIPGADLLEKLDYVTDQLAPGGLFEDFTFAKSADVLALATSAGIDISTQSSAINSAPTLALGELLSFTAQGRGSKAAIGLLDETIAEPSLFIPIPLGAEFFNDIDSGPNGLAGLRIATNWRQFYPKSPPGAMLYREIIPEPTSFLFAFLGWMGLLNCRRLFSSAGKRRRVI